MKSRCSLPYRGAEMRDIRLLDVPVDPSAAVEALTQATPDAGGIASFVGKVRATGGVEALELSHYEPLTLPEMESLADRAEQRIRPRFEPRTDRCGELRGGLGEVVP